MAKEPTNLPALRGEIVEATEYAVSIAAARAVEIGLDAGVIIAITESQRNQSVIIARRYPRENEVVLKRINDLATLDGETAGECVYSLPRGRDENGKPKAITGPSVRFMELVGHCWGNNNVEAYITAIDRKEGFVEAMGVYTDYETNSTLNLRVRRRIKGKNGQVFNDDMIGVTSNAAASIAMRNAIQKGVPKPIWSKAYGAVQAVVRGDMKSLGARRVELLTAYRDNLNIPADRVYALLGIKGENDIGLDELVVARGFYSALKNNEVTLDDLIAQAGPLPQTRSLEGAFGAAQEKVDPDTGEITTTVAETKTEPAKETPAKDDTFPGDRPARTGPSDFMLSKTPAAAAKEAEPTKAEPVAGEKPAPSAPAKEPTQRKARAPKEEPKPEPVAEVVWPDPIDDVLPDKDEVYHIDGDTVDEEGRRATYKNGEPFSRALHSTGHAVYTEDAHREFAGSLEEEAAAATPDEPEENPAGAAAADEEAPAPEEQQAPASTVGVDPDVVEALQAYANKVKGAESWLQIKAAINTLRQTTAWTEKIDAAEQRMARLAAYNSAAALVAAGKDPVKNTEDPSFYALWLMQAEPAEVKPVFMKLVASPSYIALPEPARKKLAADSMAAAGEV